MKYVFAILLIPCAMFAGAWGLMLVFGVLHHEVAEAIPAIGYVPALAIYAVFGLYRGTVALFQSAFKEVLK